VRSLARQNHGTILAVRLLRLRLDFSVQTVALLLLGGIVVLQRGIPPLQLLIVLLRYLFLYSMAFRPSIPVSCLGVPHSMH